MYPAYIQTAAFVVIIVCYFDVVKHYQVINALGGYLIKIWLPPFVLLVLLAALKLLRRDISIAGRGLEVGLCFLLGYLVFGVTSLFVNETLFNVGKFGLIMFAPVTCFFITLEVCRNDQLIRKILQSLFVVGVILALYTEYVFVFSLETGPGFGTIESRAGEVGANDQVVFEALALAQETVRRHTLPGIEQTKFAAMLGSLVLVGFYFFSSGQKGYARWPFIIGSAIMCVTIVNTLSRSSAIALLAGMSVLLFYNKGSRLLLFPIIVGVVLVGLSNDFLVERLLQSAGAFEFASRIPIVNEVFIARGNLTEAEGHFDTVYESLEIFMANPLLGQGTSSSLSTVAVQEHNRYLHLLSTTGAMTALPYVGFIVWLTWKARYILIREATRGRDIGLAAVLLASTVLCAVKINAEGGESYYYWIVFGLTSAWIRNTLTARSSVPDAVAIPRNNKSGLNGRKKRRIFLGRRMAPRPVFRRRDAIQSKQGRGTFGGFGSA